MLVTGTNDAADNGIQIAQDFAGGNAENGEAARGEIGVAALVTFGATTVIVRLAVDLDDKAAIQTDEIEDQVVQRMLTAEFVAGGALAKFTPDQNLGKIA